MPAARGRAWRGLHTGRAQQPSRPAGLAEDPGLWTRQRHPRASKLVTVYQARTCETHTVGCIRRDRSGARWHCRVSRSISAFKSRLSRRARTTSERRFGPDQGVLVVLALRAPAAEKIVGNGRGPKTGMPGGAVGRIFQILGKPA